MNKLYSLIWLLLFAGVLFSFYKFFRFRENLYRVAFWACAVVLLLIVQFEPKPLEFTKSEQAEFVSALRETSNELKKFSEIDEVYFSSITADDELEIKLIVNNTDYDNFSDEAQRIFWHALIDSWSNPSNIPFQIKIKVIVIPKENLTAPPSAFGV